MSSEKKGKTPDFGEGVPASRIVEGAMLGGECRGEKVLVLRKGGKLCALSAECTHQGADLATGALTGTSLRCPWHHARYDVRTGESVGAPAFEPLTRYEVTEHDGQVVVGGKLEPVTPKQMPFDRRVVIIGAGAGGHACAEWFARHGAGAAVTLIGDESGEPYDRTLCSKEFLSGDKSREDAALAALPGVKQLRNTHVKAIDRQAQKVLLDDGKQLDYDALVLATGAAPVAPDFDGADHPAVHLLRNIDDAEALLVAAKSSKNAAVVGASFIALEAAASLGSHGLTVTVVAPEKKPLAAKFGDEVGAFVQKLHEQQGVDFRLGRKVRGYDGRLLTLDDGSEVAADLVVAGIGVQPRLSLAEAAGLDLASKDEGGGVRVDMALRSSDPKIHAIGDIAAFADARLGQRMRVEHWVVAQRQGQFVARHLLGESQQYVDTPFFWSAHYDQSLHYIGHGKPKSLEVEGKVTKGDFLVTYREGSIDAAQLACGRDQALLATEAEWDAEVLDTNTEF